MYSVLLMIHIMVSAVLIIIILMQRSATDGMGLSGSSTSFLSGRAASNLITRTTSVLAALFICTSLGLGIITARSHAGEGSIMDRISKTSNLSPLSPATTTPTKPAGPAGAGGTVAVTPAAPATPPAPAPAKPSVPRPE